MEDLSIDELKYLLNYYKQRCSDLELSFLQMQVKAGRKTVEQSAPVPATKVTKTKS